MKTNQIHNLMVQYLTRHYHTAPYKSLGQVLSYVYTFCGFDTMERCTIGENNVIMRGEVIATFVFDDEKQLPIFTFFTDTQAQEKQLLFHSTEFKEYLAGRS